MFRRGIDFSWPLIAILVGLFFLSLQLPRQWEQIARSSRLPLSTKMSTPVEIPLAATGSQSENASQDGYRSIEPADRIANNAESKDIPTVNAPSGREEVAAPQTNSVVMPIPEASITQPEIITTAAPVVEAVQPSESAIIQNTPPVQGPSVPASAEAPEPNSNAPQAKAANVATDEAESYDKVRVLRDEPSPGDMGNVVKGNEQEAHPLRSSDTSDSEIRRLPRPESQIALGEPETAPLASDAAQRPFQSTATPEAAAMPANPVRPVAPESGSEVTQAPLPIASPQLVPEPNPGVRAEVDIPVKNSLPAQKAGPVEKSDSEPARNAESAPLERPIMALGRAWVEPADLLRGLDDLAKYEATRTWAAEAAAEVRKLGPAISDGAPETAEILQHLELLTRQTPTLLLKVKDESIAEKLSYTSQALLRRLAVWTQIGRMGGMAAANAPVPAVDPHSINKCLSEIDKLTADSSEGRAWRNYLLIDSLRDWAARRRNGDDRLPRDLAQKVLARLNPMSVSSHQRQFLTTGPMADLHQEMLRHAAEPVESNHLLEHLERYESSGLSSDAHMLARDCQFLAVNSGAAQRELGERIEMHYRNANIRVAVTAELLNRLMPKREPEYAKVNDRILDVPVRGESLMASEVAVRLMPDPHRVRLALEVNGEVASLTRSMAGPATFYSDNESSYIARKPLEITLRGIRMGETEVSVDNNSTLRGIRTSLDGFPLAGRIANNIARSEHDQKMPAADAEVRAKIAAKAKERVDRETSAQIAAAAKRLDEEILGPMDSLMLDPVMVAAETTDKRFSMRIRLAGPDQLGGHTPRPQAPSDSLASVQIHESMLNNVLDRLELDGQTFDLAGLGKRLSERLHRFQPSAVDPDQEDVKITFAAKDAVHVHCGDGRIEICLSIARLSKGARKWNNFQVRAFYRPIVQGRSVDLARDGIVQLAGARISVTSQIALRGIFSKVFSQKEAIHATPEAFVKNPKLDKIVITQFVIDDGWIGAAIGPQRVVTAQRTTMRR
jgi:hypothetical protein